MEILSSNESEPRPDKLALFHAKYCDADRPVIELVDGEVIRYDNVLFYGATADRTIIFRTVSDTDRTRFRYWLGSYEHSSSETTKYDVSDHVDIQMDSQRNGSGVNITTATYMAKSLGDESVVAMRFSTSSIEWYEDVDEMPQPADVLPTPTFR